MAASYPDDLKYHSDHDWARIDGETATLGITWYAQDQLGEVVFFDPPTVGATLTKDQPYAEIESVKAVSDVYAPLAGKVVEANGRIAEDPGLINRDPTGEGWFYKLEIADAAALDALMDEAGYARFVESQA